MFKTRENEPSAPAAELIDLGTASVETRGQNGNKIDLVEDDRQGSGITNE